MEGESSLHYSAGVYTGELHTDLGSAHPEELSSWIQMRLM